MRQIVNTLGIIETIIARKKIVYFLVGVLVVVGVVGLRFMNKDEFPTFEIKQGLVVGVLPGATAQEVKEQLTKPVEEVLFSFPEVKRDNLVSYSKSGISYIYVDLDCSPEEKVEVWSKIKHGLEAARLTLPASVAALVVMDDFSAISALLIALESSDKSNAELRKYAEDLSLRLRAIPSMAGVTVLGNQKQEIAVEVDMARLSAYGISPSSLMLDFTFDGARLPEGKFQTDYVSSPVRVQSAVSSEEEIANKIVYADREGNIIRLKDIATVTRRYQRPSSMVEYNGSSACVLSLEMRPNNNIVAFGREVDKVLEEFQAGLPDSVTLTRITDQPQVVGGSVMSFVRDLVIAMVVVIFVMLMLFPLRSALIACSGVPVCIAVSWAVMYLTGMDLNIVTLAALIVVLGMIVDDSIITMDGYMDALGRQPDRVKAASISLKSLIPPMFMATAAISLMFFPIKGILTGYLGDFVKLFPWVITIALGMSLLYAIFVVPSLEVRFIKSASQGRSNLLTRCQNAFFRILQGGYERMLKKCFRYPGLTILAGCLAVFCGIWMFTQLHVQMMPMAGRDYFAVEIYLDGNSSLESTKRVSDSLQSILMMDSRVRSVTAFVGTGAPRFQATYSPKMPAANFAQLVVKTGSVKDTESLLMDYEGLYEHYFTNAVVRFKQMDYQGVTPVEVRVIGASHERLKPVADSIRNLMREQSDLLKWIHSDCDNYTSVINVKPDPQESARLGVNKAMLSLALSGAFNGSKLGAVWEDGVEVPVMVYSDAVNPSMDYETLLNCYIPTSIPGVNVPLRQVATVTPDWTLESLTRLSGEDAILIGADMRYGCSQPEAMQRLQERIDAEILPDLPEGVRVEYGGLTASNAKVIPEIVLSFACAVLVLFFFLLLHFRKVSVSLLTLVLSTLCFFGAFLGLWIFGLDFGITSVLGLISLVGIIVRNGIIMFEYAEELRFEHGMDVRNAAEEAGKRRMRPIFLTSCTTALGVLPMILTGDLLWLPMGVVICFGTILSIVLITLVMPVSYWQIFRHSRSPKGGAGKAVAAGVVLCFCVLQPVEAAEADSTARVCLSVEACKDMASRNNPYILNSQLGVKAAKAQKGEVFAEYFPRVSLNAFSYYSLKPMLEIGVVDIFGQNSFSSALNNILDRLGTTYGFDPVYRTLKWGYTANVALMQPLFTGGRLVNGNRLAALGVEAATLRQGLKEREILQEVERGYWLVVSLEEKTATLDSLKILVDTLYKDVSSACAAGLATENDLLQVRLKRNELASGMIQASNGVRLAKMNLFNSIGQKYTPYESMASDSLPHLDSIFLTDRLTELHEPQMYFRPEEEVVEGQLETRLLEISVDARRLEKKMVTGEALPQVGVGAGYGYSDLTDKGRFNGVVFATVQVPITDWGRTARKMQRYEYQIQQAENERVFLQEQLLLQVRKMWLDLCACWQQLEVARESVQTARASVEKLQSYYKAGLSPLSELLEAQTQLQQASEAYTEQSIQYRITLQAYLAL